MSRPGTVFTPTAVEIIRELAGQGKSAMEIANVIGSTPGSVRVRCSQLKIRLLRPQARLRQSQPLPVPKHSLVVYLTPTVYAALKRKAQNMQKPTVELAASLLAAIVRSNIYEAVLDEGEE
jgi:hypothetical protein